MFFASGWVDHGYWRFGKPKVYGHAVIYAECFGEVPDGSHIHHVCENKLCVNPEHLEAVVASEHPTIHASTSTHCRRGHERTPENTFVWASGTRTCRVCQRESRAEYHAANRERINAGQRERYARRH